MESHFFKLAACATALKVLLTRAFFSTDFEVHRNWLAITYNLPMSEWYTDITSKWTLDYPPFFAFFEWILSEIAVFVDPKMLLLTNHNYASEETVYFQRGSVIVMDILYIMGVWRCLRVLKINPLSHKHFAAELVMLLNVGLLLIDHIHFQYNGMLFGILLFSISYLLEGRYLKGAFTFAILLNFKHIFLYIAPAFGVYLLKNYCLDSGKNPLLCAAKLCAVSIAPFFMAFGPFWNQIPQVLSRLFPFKRGLTHAYWAPNFWALYNTADKVAAYAMGVSKGASTASGLVQEFEHVVLPTVTPMVTFILTALFMLPALIKLFYYTSKSESGTVFLRTIVLCATSSFMFGWHVHEKAILMCLIPLSLLYLVHHDDAKYAFLLSFVGYFSLFPLIYEVELILIRYSLFISYVAMMYSQLLRSYKVTTPLWIYEKIYLCGFLFIPLYEHIISPLTGLSEKLPFMPLLLTSLYCSLGVVYFFVTYYWYTLDLKLDFSVKQPKTKTSALRSKKAKLKQKLK